MSDTAHPGQQGAGSEDSVVMESRLRASEAIQENPQDYMVCECCGSIVRNNKIYTCPNCNAYRFDSSKLAVIVAAVDLGSRLPVSVCDWT